MSDALESLKRVLGRMKQDARSMRKGNLEARYAPKPKPKPAEEEFKALEIPDEEPGGEAAEPDAKKTQEAAEIKKLLARM